MIRSPPVEFGLAEIGVFTGLFAVHHSIVLFRASMRSTLRAMLRMFKFDPVKFVTSAGECLFFVWPKKSHQKKGHPRATAGQKYGRFPRRAQSAGPLTNSPGANLNASGRRAKRMDARSNRASKHAQTVSAENSPPITPSSAVSMGSCKDNKSVAMQRFYKCASRENLKWRSLRASTP